MPNNTRFALGSDNRITQTTTTLLNGSGGTAPAKSEDAQYPMVNLQVQDRYSIWRSANALSGTFYCDWDMGADVNIDVAAIHGFRRASGQSSPASFDLQYRTAATGYNGGASGWTTSKTGILLPGRDAGVQLPGTIKARYWRFVFGVGGSGGGFSIGQLYLGLLSYDLGYMYASMASDRFVHARARYNLAMSIPVINKVGDPYRLLNYPLDGCSTAARDIFRAVAMSETPTTLFTPYDECLQVVLANDAQEHAHVWSSDRDFWNSSLEMLVLA